MKKTILHIIHDLGRGGAETMLVKVVGQLSEYNNIVVTLFPENHFGEDLSCRYYCLNVRSVLLLPFYVSRLKKIIRENNVDIVHSHLFWPTVLARMSTPKEIPLITTIHAFIASSLEYKKWHVRFLDKLTYKRRKNTIIVVAKGALDEYFNFLRIKRGKAYVLHTFVDINIFNNDHPVEKEPGNIFKLVTVGALRKQKNHIYLLKAFKLLNKNDFQLDIYGDGPLKNELIEFITANDVNVRLMGEFKNMNTVLDKYDLFVMSSTYEGFSLSVLEAMALRIPLLLSDIESYREQCQNTAEYFDLADMNDFISKLKKLTLDPNWLKQSGFSGHERAVNNFTLEQHMEGLRKIYSEALNV